MSTPRKDPKYRQRDRRYRREDGAGGPPRTGWYIWRVAPQDVSRTRTDHLRLNGQRFRWDAPPVVDSRTGARGHPGHDPRCRCYAEAVRGPVDGPEQS